MTWTEWRYRTGSTMAHAIQPDEMRRAAKCGIETREWFDWLGTGNQAEYERAASLPRCQRCLAALAAEDLST